MGFIRSPVGRLTIESSRESFLIHYDPDRSQDPGLIPLWAEHPHPEIANVDLDDLVMALLEYKGDLRRRMVTPERGLPRGETAQGNEGGLA